MRPLQDHILAMVLLTTIIAPRDTAAKEYAVPLDDVAGFFARLPSDATVVSFSSGPVYKCSFDIILPDRQLLIIDGKGAKLVLGPNSNGFTRRVKDQQDAMKRVASRYVIKDFASIEGGLKGIDLAATLGSRVSNCRLSGQSQVAVDLRFCLMCRLEMVLVTNPRAKGIQLRQGDWVGASATNSQSNSTVLDQCRVYCSSTTTQAFSVRNSGGVRMTDCISEGGVPEHDLFVSAAMDGREDRTASNPVVKSFMLSNFHVEHKNLVASIHVNMPSKAIVDLSNVHWNSPQTTPVVDLLGGQLNLSDIGWFRKDFRIRTRLSSPHIDVDRCHNFISMGKKDDRTPTRAGVFILEEPFPGQDVLGTDHIRISRASQ